MSFSDIQYAKSVRSVLAERAVTFVNFTLAPSNVTVNTTHFISLSGSIDANRVRCKVDATQITNGATAVYDPSGNTLYGVDPDIQYIDQKATILHECTHAVLDLMQGTMTNLTDETCAYIAQSIFVVASGGQVSFKGGPSAAALKVVESKNMAIIGAGNAGSPLVFTAKELAPLETAIKTHPLYAKTFSQNAIHDG